MTGRRDPSGGSVPGCRRAGPSRRSTDPGRPRQAHACAGWPIPPSRPRGRRDLATASPLDAQGTHHAQYLIPADPIPALTDQPGMRLPVAIHGHEPVRTDQRDVSNPQFNEAPGVRQIGPTPNRTRCASTYAIQSASCRVEPVPTKKPTPNPISHSRGAARHSPGAASPTPRILPAPSYSQYPSAAANAATTGDTQALRHAFQGLRLRHVIGARVRQQPDGPLLELRIISSGHDSIISSSRESRNKNQSTSVFVRQRPQHAGRSVQP